MKGTMTVEHVPVMLTEAVDALAVRAAKQPDRAARQILRPDHACAHGVVDIMIDVGDAVSQMHAAALKRLRAHRT